MERIEKRVSGAARAVALVGFFGLLLLAAMTTLDVLLRWFFAMPIHGVNDVSSVVMAVVIAACIPANLAMKKNIAVEMFGTFGGVRLRRLVEFIASLFTLVFIALIAWRFVPYADGLRQTGDRTWVLGWAVWPWWAVSALLMIFAALVQVVVTLSDLRALLLGAEFSDDTADPGSTDAIL